MPWWYWQLVRDRHYEAGYWPEPNLGDCAYLRTMNAPPERRQTCTHGCWEEPACITNAPGRHGWPPYRTQERLVELKGYREARELRA